MKRPAAKGQGEIKISNPQFHKSGNSWTLKSGSKQVIAVPCLWMFSKSDRYLLCLTVDADRAWKQFHSYFMYFRCFGTLCFLGKQLPCS